MTKFDIDPSSIISADSTTLMDQAPWTIQAYMSRAIDYIDHQGGPGYSQQHPELVGAFIQACAIDFLAGTIGREIQNAGVRIAEAIESISQN